MAGQEAVHVKGCHGFPAALRQHDGRAVVALGNLLVQAGRHFFHAPRHFRHNHDFRARGAGGLQGDVTAVAAHALHHMRAVVGAAGGADGADGFGADLHSRLVAQRHLSVGKVVVNRAGDADAGDALLAQRACALEAAIAADDDQAVYAGFHCIFVRLFPVFCLVKFLTSGGKQDRPAFFQDIGHGRKFHDPEIFLQKAVISPDNAHGNDIIVKGCPHHAADRHIHPRRVAAAGQYTDTFFSINHT